MIFDIQPFIDWATAKKSRSVEINIRNDRTDRPVSIFVYDGEFKNGRFVKSVSEIDLESEREIRDRAEYERLKIKYGEVTTNAS